MKECISEGVEGEIDWDGEIKKGIKRDGGERKKRWKGVKHFFLLFKIIYTLHLMNFKLLFSLYFCLTSISSSSCVPNIF